VLLFFDVKAISVKAYGGRCYCQGRAPVQPRPQKTRGRFCLFSLYETNRGRVRWGFMPGKDSDYVCRFMRRVRRWYPRQEVWVALDQDRPHPCKSRQTRRAMRELGLHWISLPKRSPDDNPVETLFSETQVMLLESSNDPSAHATQRRISSHFRRRNRRKDRFLRIHYLPHTHNSK
jgi:transposase